MPSHLCELCGSNYMVERHHIFGASRKPFSEKYKLTIYLCYDHHQHPSTGVHFNEQLMREIHRQGQEQFNREHPDLDFMKIFGKNYIY